MSVAVLSAAVYAPSYAAGFPENPVTVIVPFPPGGVFDTTARLTAQKVQESLGQPVVAENKPGVNGAIGASQVAQAKPDGHTLLVGLIGVYEIFLSRLISATMLIMALILVVTVLAPTVRQKREEAFQKEA